MGCGQKSLVLEAMPSFFRKATSPNLALFTRGNEMIPGTVHRSPGIYLAAENKKKKRKSSLRRPYDEGCATIHCLKWGLLLASELGRIAKKRERRKGRDSFINVC